MISKYLRDLADKIDSNECKLSPDEEHELLSIIAHQKLNKIEASNLLGISSRTFDRKIQNGELPSGRKDIGSNLLYWYKDELIK